MQVSNKYKKFQYLPTNSDIFDSIEKRVSSQNYGATVIVPNLCNNMDIFNGGFAKALSEKYPSVKANYHMLGKTFLKNNLGHCQFLNIYEDIKYKHKLYIVNMVAQNGLRNDSNTRPLNYAALVKCMINIAKFIDQNYSTATNDNVEIHAPKFGSGLAGGNWNFISNLIEDIWHKYTVYIYDYKKTQ